MFGVFQCAFLALFVGCSTQASPFERKERSSGLQVEVIEHVPHCEEKTKLSDDVMVSIATRGEINGHVIQGYPYVHLEFKLGENPLVLLEADEALLGMCPGDIRRLKYQLDEQLGSQGPIIIYEVTLESVGTDSGSVLLLPPDIDTNTDQTEDELYDSLSTAIRDYLPKDSPSFEWMVDEMFILLAGYLYEL